MPVRNKKTAKARPKKSGHARQKAATPKAPKKPRKTLEERLMDWEDDDDDAPALHISEAMRANLLKEEFKLRKKQPTAWTKTKYRKFAFFNTGQKKEKEKILIQEEHEIESDQKKKDKLKHDKRRKKND